MSITTEFAEWLDDQGIDEGTWDEFSLDLKEIFIDNFNEDQEDGEVLALYEGAIFGGG